MILYRRPYVWIVPFATLSTIALLPVACRSGILMESLSHNTSALADTATVSIKPVATEKTNYRSYQRAEFAITITGGGTPYANPFDPDEVTADAILTGPRGQSYTVPAFWYAPYAWKQDAPDVEPVADQQPGWRLRIVPTAPGRWNLVVRVKDKTGTRSSSPLGLTVSAATQKAHGFLRRATGAGRNRYFEYSDGSPYFAVGLNLCWADRRGLPSFADWFGQLGNAGGNYARLWMASRPLENAASGPGKYDLKNAAYFDKVLELAETNGLRCMMAFGTYGELISGGYFNEGKWSENAYNSANGGPVPQDTPDAFFTNPDARKMYRNRLRYLIARYGAYESMGFWEIWNERAAPTDWYAEMATYLKANDPYQRPVTTSYQTTAPAEIWNIPAMDLSQTHRYGDEGSMRDLAPTLAADAHDHNPYKKPHLMGEYGITWRAPDIKFDEKGTGTNIHNGIWVSAFTGNAGSGMTWWWDNYVAPKNLFGVFHGLAQFAKTVDWSNRAFEPLDIPAPLLPDTDDKTPHDLILEAPATWGAKAKAPVTVGIDGATTGQNNLIGYLYAPSKTDLRSVQELNLNLPRPGKLRLHIGTVSAPSELRVQIDGKPIASFPFDPTPVGKGTYKETKLLEEYNIYQAHFDTVREVALPVGKHKVTIENTTGDWIGIRSYEIAGVYETRYTPLKSYALQDKTTGETLVWLQDPASNWASDHEGVPLAPWKGIRLSIPVPKAGTYQLQWWDTRTGKILKTTPAKTKDSPQLNVIIPDFKRDIALRLIHK